MRVLLIAALWLAWPLLAGSLSFALVLRPLAEIGAHAFARLTEAMQ